MGGTYIDPWRESELNGANQVLRSSPLRLPVRTRRRWPAVVPPDRYLGMQVGPDPGWAEVLRVRDRAGPPLAPNDAPPALESKAPGEYPSGQRGGAVNAMAMPSQVRILPPPSLATQCSNEAIGSRKDLRIGRARIWGKSQITIPAGPRRAAGLQGGDDLYVEARDDGTLLVTRIETG
jgi:hypothetical protein